MASLQNPMDESIRSALDGSVGAAPPAQSAPAPEIRVTGQGALASRFDVTGLAAASIAAAGAEIARFAAGPGAARALEDGRGRAVRVTVDRRLASMWFGFSIRPQGWTLPSPWDPIAGDYRTRDGWIRLHTNAPDHRRAALAVLGVNEDRESVAAAVAEASCDALEAEIVARGGCAARMRSSEAWSVHPQGRSVAAEPLVAWRTAPIDAPALRPRRAPDPLDARSAGARSAARPLAGIRVLDLTRVLAGPVASRLLAAYGADVLRIDPPDWDEPGVVPEVTVGKRCAGLDLRAPADREQFEALLAGADVLIHGYRPGALAGLGYDDGGLRALNAGFVDVALCAYGWTGPWSGRRGFDSLVQMSSGIADAGQSWAGSERPTPLPVQALDHATGYLMAAAAVRGLLLRRDHGLVATARLSLARTAVLLDEAGPAMPAPGLAAESAEDLAPGVEATDWGPARRLHFPVEIDGVRSGFERPACGLRSTSPQWRER